MNHYQFFQHFFCLAPGALDAVYLKDQGEGVKIVNKLRVDGLIQLDYF